MASYATRHAAAKRHVKPKSYKKAAPTKAMTTMVKKIIEKETEQKYVDCYPEDPTEDGLEGISSDLSNNNSCYLLNGVIRGDGNWNRIGKDIKLQAIRLRLGFRTDWETDNTTTASNQYLNPVIVRYIVLWDKDGSAANPTFNSVFGGLLNDETAITGLGAFLQVEKMQRYRILLDQSFAVDTSQAQPAPSTITNLGATNPFVPLYSNTGSKAARVDIREHYIDLSKKNMKSEFQGNDGSAASISTGALYLMVKCSTHGAYATNVRINSAGTNAMSFTRLRYIDP